MTGQRAVVRVMRDSSSGYGLAAMFVAPHVGHREAMAALRRDDWGDEDHLK